mgnify:CR=1 FL=1
MSEDILINFTPQETRVAIMQHGAVQELHIERNASRGLVGNIYVGRVVRILPGMQSAFVDIGLEKDAFLYVADVGEEVEDFDRFGGIEEGAAPAEAEPEEAVEAPSAVV